MSNSSEQSLVVRAGEGELISAAGVEHLFKLTGQHTGGRFGIERFVVPPITLGARPHVHRGHDEYFYALQGRLTVDLLRELRAQHNTESV